MLHIYYPAIQLTLESEYSKRPKLVCSVKKMARKNQSILGNIKGVYLVTQYFLIILRDFLCGMVQKSLPTVTIPNTNFWVCWKSKEAITTWIV